MLYLVVEGDSTLLLARDAFLDLEAIKFMNNQRIETPEPHIVNVETSRHDEHQGFSRLALCYVNIKIASVTSLVNSKLK